MGLLTTLLGLPLAPLRGIVWVADQVAAEAERQMNDPDFIQQQLDEVTAARASGALSTEEADGMERALVARLIRRRSAPPQDGRG